MTTKVHATYKNGAFVPATPVEMPDGTEVELTVTANLSAVSLAHALEEIANLPPEGPQDGFSGANHDAVLYWDS